MALITKIREKTVLVVGVVAVGLILFIVGGDLLRGNSSLFGPDNNVGEIAGEDVGYDQYQQAIEEVRYNYAVNTGRTPTEREMNAIRQQAWDKMIADIAFKKQFDELGIEVTDEELVDMVQGNNISPEIRQAFTNPETGEFSRDQIVAYLQNLPQLQPQQQVAWQLFEKNLNDSRIRLKYDNLILMSEYVTDAEAKQQHKEENTVAEVDYLYVPFYVVSDSAINISDSQLQEYINKHQEEFKVEQGRTIEYVSFPLVPSAEDSAYFQEDLAELKENFASASNDSSFAAINTDGQGTPYGSFNIGQIPTQLQDQELEAGQVYGPYMANGSYMLYKVSAIREDTAMSAKASHILFRTEEGNESEVKAKAQDVLNQIKKGADFAEMAREYGEDGTASQGGDLGWFSEGRMVPEFEEAVFAQKSAGLISKLVKTDYGYHIIDVTEAPTSTVYDIATVANTLYPSDNTRDEAYRKADAFYSSVDDLSSFESAASADSINIATAEGIGPNAQSVRGLGEARQVVRWAFNEASVGGVSEVFELENAYVVAALTGKTEAGTAELANIRDEVTAKVKAELKGKQITEKLKGMMSGKSLEEIAQAYGNDANVYSSSDLKMSSNTLPNVGYAPKAIGEAFALKEGQMSEPVVTENGVVVVKTNAITEAPEIADYSSYKDQIAQRQRQQATYSIGEAIQDFSNIEDERYKFF